MFNQFHQDLAQQILMESAFGESFHAIKHQQLCISQILPPPPLCSMATQELLDRPYINKRTGLDFVVMCVMGFILGLLSIPYCCLIDEWQALSMLLGCVGWQHCGFGWLECSGCFLGW